jgi:predicted ribosomally synthesized peptide with SipW-like signal peptide
MKKIGLISLALVMALGALGVTFAGWTDSVTVNGTVNTGDVKIDIIDYSGTYVWKVESQSNNIFIQQGWDDEIGDPPNLPNVIDAFPNYVASPDMGSDGVDPVAYAIARDGEAGENADIFVEFYNLFPCVDFQADFLLHYNGSIPVRVNVLNLTADVDGLITDPEDPDHNATISIQYWEYDEVDDVTIGDPFTEEMVMQLHKCDHVLVVITIHLIQEEGEATNQNKSGTITGQIGVKQWNEVADYIPD